MVERNRSGFRGVENNPESYLGGIFVLAVALALGAKGVAESNLALIGAGALLYGGYEGIRWFLIKRRERQELQQIRPPRPLETRT